MPRPRGKVTTPQGQQPVGVVRQMLGYAAETAFSQNRHDVRAKDGTFTPESTYVVAPRRRRGSVQTDGSQ